MGVGTKFDKCRQVRIIRRWLDLRERVDLDPLDYYGLVLFLARQKHQRLREAGVCLELDDLVQEGFVGLLEACRRFDAGRGASFSTFAYPRIAGAMDDLLRRLDHLPQGQRATLKRVESARARLAQTLGREPLAREVADGLALSVETVESAEAKPQWAEGWVSWEAAREPAGDPDETLLAMAVESGLDQALEPIERQVLLLRARDQITLRHTAEIVGRPLQTVFNIELRAKRKMRDYLEKHGWTMGENG